MKTERGGTQSTIRSMISPTLVRRIYYSYPKAASVLCMFIHILTNLGIIVWFNVCRFFRKITQFDILELIFSIRSNVSN